MIQRNPDAAKTVDGHRPVAADSLSSEKTVLLAVALHIHVAKGTGHEVLPIHSQYVIGGADPKGSTPILRDTVDRFTQHIGQVATDLQVTEIAKGQPICGSDPQQVLSIFKNRSHI